MKAAKQVVLINPPVAEIPKSQIFVTTIPLGLGYIAAYLLENGFKVKLVDALGLAIERRNDWKHGLKLRGLAIEEVIKAVPKEAGLICVSTNFTSQYKVYTDLVSRLRAEFPKKRIIVGGNDATANYARYLDLGADYAVLGESEETILRLAKSITAGRPVAGIDGLAYKKNGKLVCREKKAPISDLDRLPFPARHLFPLENYWKAKCSHGPVNKRFTPITSSRGCPYNCTYCSSSVFWGRHWNARSPENFVQEMQHCVEKYGITEFEIEDDNLTLKVDRAKKIFELIIEKKLPVTWTTPNGVRSENLDLGMLKLMKESGCSLLVVAPESGSQKILRKVYNKHIDLDNIANVVRDCSKIGIKTTAFFVVGLPVETEQDRKETKAYLKRLVRLGLDEVGVFPCMPYPNTEVRKRYFDENTKGIDDLTIGAVPEWYPNCKQVEAYVKHLYRSFLLYKIIYQPGKMLRLLANVLLNRQSLKIEREIARKRKNLFSKVSSGLGRK